MLQLPCHQAVCLVGNNPNGSFALAGGLNNATEIILHGTSMLEWLIGRLVGDSDSVSSTGTGELNNEANVDLGGAAIAGALSLVCTVFCVAVAIGYAAVAIGKYINSSLWSSNLQHVTRILESVERDVEDGTISQHAASELTIEVSEQDGWLPGWNNQSFSIAMFVPAGFA